jgi:hypothetical protein
MDHARRKNELQAIELVLENLAAAPQELHILSIRSRIQAPGGMGERPEARQRERARLRQPVQITQQPGDIDHLDRFCAFLNQLPERNGALAENQRLADALDKPRGRETVSREPASDIDLLAHILNVICGDSDHDRIGREPIVGVRAQPQQLRAAVVKPGCRTRGLERLQRRLASELASCRRYAPTRGARTRRHAPHHRSKARRPRPSRQLLSIRGPASRSQRAARPWLPSAAGRAG